MEKRREEGIKRKLNQTNYGTLHESSRLCVCMSAPAFLSSRTVWRLYLGFTILLLTILIPHRQKSGFTCQWRVLMRTGYTRMYMCVVVSRSAGYIV